MSDDYLPLNIWLYFGFTLGTDTHSAYTDGLKLFNKPEIEIVDSAQPLGKMRLLLLTVSHWVLKDDYALVEGAAFRMKTGEVISIQLSPGRSLEEQTYKLGF